MADTIDTHIAMPVIMAVEASEGFSVKVTWEDGTNDTVDLSPVLLRYRAMKPLRDDRALFVRVRLGYMGGSIVWTDDIDMSAEMVAQMARLMRPMRHDEFAAFMDLHRLTLDAAAVALGISRRQVAYYASGKKSVDHTVALACRGYEAVMGHAAA